MTRSGVWFKLLSGVSSVAASGMLLGAGRHPVAAWLFLASGVLLGTVAIVDATRARRSRQRPAPGGARVLEPREQTFGR